MGGHVGKFYKALVAIEKTKSPDGGEAYLIRGVGGNGMDRTVADFINEHAGVGATEIKESGDPLFIHNPPRHIGYQVDAAHLAAVATSGSTEGQRSLAQGFCKRLAEIAEGRDQTVYV